MKLLYFTSEFPGQTHIFFWREYNELLRMGIDAHLVSTRISPIGIQSHSWSTYAKNRTLYLYPLSIADYWNALITLLTSPWRSWKKIFTAFFRENDLSFKDKGALIAHLVMAAKMVRLINAQGFEHIHCTTCAATANIAMFCRFLTGISYSLSLLGPRLETYGPNQANKWRHASFGLFQSMKLLQETRQAIPGMIPRLHAFAPVGVNTDIVKRTQPYQTWTPGRACILYSCGRLNPIKGHEYVIRSVGVLKERGYAVNLVIGGEDIDGGLGYRKTIEQEIKSHHLESSVTLIGAVSEEENIKRYQAAHIYVMGSLDEAAGAVAAMEAMAMEVPVVMPDVGATHELITSGQEGILVEAKNSIALADAVEHLLNNPLLATQMGCRGRRKIEEKFNHHISASVIVDFLAEIHASHSNA